MNVTRDDLLKATTLKRLGHVAFHLGLTATLARPMTAILGAQGRGRLVRELDQLAEQCDGRDLASLLAYGDDLLRTKRQQPLRTKLLTLARSFLVVASESGDADADAVPHPSSRAELERWATENAVAPLLTMSVYRELNPTQPHLFSGMVDRNVENGPFDALLTDPDLERRTTIAPPRLKRLRDAAWAHLQQRAEEAKEAARELDEARLLTPPEEGDDTPRAQLIRLAQSARVALATEVVARPRSRIDAMPFAIEDGTPPVFVHTEAPADRYAFPTKVRIPLGLSAPLTTSCSDHKTPCNHQLAGLDALLNALIHGDEEAVARIVDPVGLPDWSRGLKALDAVLATEDAIEPTKECLVSWGVSWGGRRPEITPTLRATTRAGGLGKPRTMKPDKLLDGGWTLDPDDRHLAELLELYALMPNPSGQRASRILQRALERLIDHPRVFRHPDGTPLVVRRAAITLVTARGDGHVRLLPSVDNQVLALDAFDARNIPRVDRLALLEREGELILVEVSETLESVLYTLRQHDFRLPERALPELVQRLPSFAGRVPVALDRDVPRSTVPARRHLEVRLNSRGRGLTASAALVPLANGPSYPPGVGPVEVLGIDENGRLLAALRDPEAEIEWARERLHDLLPNAESDERPWRFALARPQDALDALSALRSAEDVTLTWPGGQPWRVTKEEATSQGLRIQLEDRRDWFGVRGDVEIADQRVPLDALVQSVRQGDSFVALGPGQWARISSELKAQVAALEPHVTAEDGELTVSPAAAEALETLGSASAEFVRSVRWQANLERLNAAKETDDTVPESLQAELRDYQRAGYAWMMRLATWGLGACLADDMGLGKTLQALAVLTGRAEQGPQLVVAPTSVVYNWVREAKRFAPALEPRLYIGPDRADQLQDLGPGSLLITSYGLVVRDLEALKGIRFASLVLDEAQAIKNAQSQRSLAVRELDTEWRLALSGTPVENHLGELWALFAAVAPGLLGGWNSFRDRFLLPIERDGKRARAEALSRLIRPFVLRRTKREVATELPPRTSVDLDVVLTDAERETYEQARGEAVAALAGHDGQARFQALAALTKLRQLACHPRLIDASSEVSSSKLARFVELARNLVDAGQRALVFSQFTRHLALVRDALDEIQLPYLYLDGQTPPEARAERVQRFQEGGVDLFLISLKAGGTGLTLTAADTVIHLDPWWNPAVEDQATDRAHRIGQTKPVTVYRLVAKGTIEESILQLHADKRALVAQVLDGTQTVGSMSTDELIGLIQSGAGPT